MKDIPDNVVYNETKLEYDAFKKPYPTNLNSPNFEKLRIKKVSNTAITSLKIRFKEINSQYEKLIKDIKYNELVYNASYNFKPIAGKDYYLYEKKGCNFLSIVKPNEWNQKFIGSFMLMSNDLWKRTSSNS